MIVGSVLAIAQVSGEAKSYLQGISIVVVSSLDLYIYLLAIQSVLIVQGVVYIGAAPFASVTVSGLSTGSALAS